MAQCGSPPARRADRINSAESPRLAAQSRGTRCARRALDLRAGRNESPQVPRLVPRVPPDLPTVPVLHRFRLGMPTARINRVITSVVHAYWVRLVRGRRSLLSRWVEEKVASPRSNEAVALRQFRDKCRRVPRFAPLARR